MAKSKYLSGAVYRLGENRVRITDVVGYEERLAKLKIALGQRELENCCFFTTGNVYQLVYSAIAETIRISGMSPRVVDCIVICSSHFSDSFNFRNRNLATAIIKNGLSPRLIQGVSGAGCVDLVRGIEMACSYLELERYQNILIVGVESLCEASHVDRIVEYACISDSAVSCVVSTSLGESSISKPLRIVAEVNETLWPRVGGGMPINETSAYAQCIFDALNAGAVGLSRVAKVFGNNIFSPIKKARETCAGIRKEQMYFENARRVGHCLSCDTIMNLVDYGIGGGGEYFVLFAEAEGHSGAILLRELVEFP